MEELKKLMRAASAFGLNYVFIDKGMVADEVLNQLKKQGFSVVVGQGEVARIKISW